MKEKIVLLAITLLSTSLICGATFITSTVIQSTTHTYPDDFPGQTLQEAIENGTVKDGDTIYVKQGTYYVHLNVTKSITLEGFHKDTTILDGMGNGTVVKVIADNVKISEFTIQRGSPYGVYLYGTSNSNVSRNIIKNNSYGIRLSSGYCTLRDNDIKNNEYNFGVSGGFIHDIDISNKVDGKPIYYWVNQHDKSIPSDAGYVAIVNSTGITAENLSLQRNCEGVLVVCSTNSIIQNVTLSDMETYITLTSSENNLVQGNKIICTRFIIPDFYGIQLTRSNSNVIVDNIIRNYLVAYRGIGFILDKSVNNSIIANNISKTIYSMQMQYSNGSIIFHNNFQYIGNLPKLQDSFDNKFDNGYEGNYWSDYTGNDTNGDGIGETRYVIDGDNQDNYPLVSKWGAFRTFKRPMEVEVYPKSTQKLYTFSNSTLGYPPLGFTFDGNLTISLKVTSGYLGFLSITIPRNWLDAPFNITIDDNPVGYTLTPTVNATHSSIYITYSKGNHIVKIKGTERGSIMGDLNGDGAVNILDCIIMANNFGSRESSQ